MQIQADHQDICSDISREHVKPNLQHGEVTHGCEQRGRVFVAYGTSCCLLPYLPPSFPLALPLVVPPSRPPSKPHPPLLSLEISLKFAQCSPLLPNFPLPFPLYYSPLKHFLFCLYFLLFFYKEAVLVTWNCEVTWKVQEDGFPQSTIFETGIEVLEIDPWYLNH